MTDTYRHKTRGTFYTVEGVAELQSSSHPVEEGALLVVYRGEDGKLWARRALEFYDGRFEKVTP